MLPCTCPPPPPPPTGRRDVPAVSVFTVTSSQVMQGIALASNPDYKVLGAAYPWIARRLLLDTAPELRATLRSILYKVSTAVAFTAVLGAMHGWGGWGRARRLGAMLRSHLPSPTPVHLRSDCPCGPLRSSALTEQRRSHQQLQLWPGLLLFLVPPICCLQSNCTHHLPRLPLHHGACRLASSKLAA